MRTSTEMVNLALELCLRDLWWWRRSPMHSIGCMAYLRCHVGIPPVCNEWILWLLCLLWTCYVVDSCNGGLIYVWLLTISALPWEPYLYVYMDILYVLYASTLCLLTYSLIIICIMSLLQLIFMEAVMLDWWNDSASVHDITCNSDGSPMFNSELPLQMAMNLDRWWWQMVTWRVLVWRYTLKWPDYLDDDRHISEPNRCCIYVTFFCFIL